MGQFWEKGWLVNLHLKGNKFGSGILINDQGFILTAFHNVYGNTAGEHIIEKATTSLDGNWHQTILHISDKNNITVQCPDMSLARKIDLIAIKAEGTSFTRSPLQIATQLPEENQPVILLYYNLNHPKGNYWREESATVGPLFYEDGFCFFPLHKINGIPGASGGGVFTTDGKLLGIIKQKTDGTHDYIATFLGDIRLQHLFPLTQHPTYDEKRIIDPDLLKTYVADIKSAINRHEESIKDITLTSLEKEKEAKIAKASICKALQLIKNRNEGTLPNLNDPDINLENLWKSYRCEDPSEQPIPSITFNVPKIIDISVNELKALVPRVEIMSEINNIEIIFELLNTDAKPDIDSIKLLFQQQLNSNITSYHLSNNLLYLKVDALNLTPFLDSIKNLFSSNTLQPYNIKHVQEILNQQQECIYQHIPTTAFTETPFIDIPVAEIKPILSQIEVLFHTVNDWERKALLSEMKPFNGKNGFLRGKVNQQIYRIGIFGNYISAHVESSMGTQGRHGATTTLKDATYELPNLKVVFLIGIAFGLDKKKQRLGDVLIADSIFPYEHQKLNSTSIIHRGQEILCGDTLSRCFSSLKQDWKLPLYHNRLVTVHQGLVLSGEKLVNDPVFVKSLTDEFPTAIGGEMEAAGGYAAIRPPKEVILIKSICDWADGNKNDTAQPFAAFTAVSLAKHVLSKPDVLHPLINTNDQNNQDNQIHQRHQNPANALKQQVEAKNNSVTPNIENIYIYLSIDGTSVSKIGGIFKYDYKAWLSYYGNKKKEYQTRQLWTSTDKDANNRIPFGQLSLDEIKKDLLNFLYNSAKEQEIPEITHTLTEKLIIEVFLPDDLLDHSIEDWLADGVTEVGYSYPIVTRSYTRTFKATSQQWMDKCLVKWNTIKQICDLNLLDFLTNVTLSNSLNFIDIKHQEDKQNLELIPFNCIEKEELKRILSKKETISCILINKELFDTAPNILGQAIREGIPVVLFFKENPGNNQNEFLLKSRLLKEFFNLPKTLHKERQNGNSTKISLLWDDPTRIPPTKNNQAKKRPYKTPS